MTGDFTLITLPENFKEIEGRDRIITRLVLGETIIITKDIEPGTRGLLFDCESEISKDILKKLNLFRHSELNSDTSKAGYFDDSGRVKPFKMGGVKCSGFFLPLTDILKIKGLEGLEREKDHLSGTIYNKVPICKKWIPKYTKSKDKTTKGSKARFKSKIVAGQFFFHPGTEHFGKALHHFEGNDIISITHKRHGSSFICSNLLCNKEPSLLKKIATLGLAKPKQIYDNIYASRSVIKNDTDMHLKNHYYDVDIWNLVNEEIKHALEPGISVYGEVSGYVPSGKMIQKGYDYGKVHPTKATIVDDKPNLNDYMDIMVYRITYTSPSGFVLNFNTPQMRSWCEKHGLQAAPLYYYGRLCDYSNNLGNGLFRELSDKFLEKDCAYCTNKVPEEGVVIRRENGLDWQAYKLKSFRFRERESKQTLIDIETQETIDA